MTRVLSVRQPWSGLIVAGVRTVENRVWSTDVRGRIAIHASGAAPSRADLADVERIAGRPFTEIVPAALRVRGAIIGTVELIACLDQHAHKPHNPWCQFNPDGDAYHWILREPRMLEKPIRVDGKLQLWRFDGELGDERPVK